MKILKERSKDEFFENSFNSYYERVVVYVYRYCQDWSAAENLTQDTYITFWQNIESVDWNRTPLPYLLHVAKNKTLNYLNREIIRTKHKNKLLSQEHQIMACALECSIIDEVTFREIESIVVKSMNEMPQKTKEFFRMSRYDCKMNEEIASLNGVSVKTVEYRITSALRILRKNLVDYFPANNVSRAR